MLQIFFAAQVFIPQILGYQRIPYVSLRIPDSVLVQFHRGPLDRVVPTPREVRPSEFALLRNDTC